ncbi:MAG: hypothetical protein WAW73_20230 [Rhodoferax sp.]
MFHVVKPLDRLSIQEICELAKHAAHRGEQLEQANVFEGEAGEAFAAAYHEYSGCG